jgi:hypothetical protein
VGFASRFVSDFLSAQVRRLRFFLGALGAMGVVVGAWSMVSATTHSMNGVHTPAVLVERFAKCQAEFQPKGESRRKEAMDCDGAYAFQNAAGAKKVRVHKTDYATVRYPLSDGSSHTATVYEGRVETRELPVGSTFEAVYDPANPGDVRARPTFSSAAYHLTMVLGGLVMLGLALLPQVIGLLGRDASGSAAAGNADAGAWGEDALKEAIARHQPAAQRVDAVASGRFGRGAGAAAAPRRQFGTRGA